ncbi:hypothetical protein [Moorena bouillonii]|uniref:hypothetical protein n=1 Tax=Moorena bouillonii TaxID=207920 RepID=UPI001BE00888|nr:hypothetical protein [Moorena bouillonii]
MEWASCPFSMEWSSVEWASCPFSMEWASVEWASCPFSMEWASVEWASCPFSMEWSSVEWASCPFSMEWSSVEWASCPFRPYFRAGRMPTIRVERGIPPSNSPPEPDMTVPNHPAPPGGIGIAYTLWGYSSLCCQVLL